MRKSLRPFKTDESRFEPPSTCWTSSGGMQLTKSIQNHWPPTYLRGERGR
jgi:hypothetical protein